MTVSPVHSRTLGREEREEGVYLVHLMDAVLKIYRETCQASSTLGILAAMSYPLLRLNLSILKFSKGFPGSACICEFCEFSGCVLIRSYC